MGGTFRPTPRSRVGRLLQHILLIISQTSHTAYLAFHLSLRTCHAQLSARWKALSDADKAPYNEREAQDRERFREESAIADAEAAAEQARVDFEGCSQRLLREMDRFRVDRANEMRATIVEYVRIQAEYTAKMSQVWSGLVPQLEAIPPADPGAVSAPVYAANQNAGCVPPIPAVPTAPMHHQYNMAPQPAAVMNGAPAPGVPGQAPAPVVGAVNQNGVAGENVGGMMYRSTTDVAM